MAYRQYTFGMNFTFEAELWEWAGKGAWCFVTVPTEYYDLVKSITSVPVRGFGSVRVEATIGNSSWKTSIFPDKRSSSYLLPIKKAIRASESLAIGGTLTVILSVLEA